MSTPVPLAAERRAALAVLVETDVGALREGLDRIGTLPAVTHLRAPEIGLVMVRGRIGGDGAPFNLGEATVTRAAVQIAGGPVGHGYALGRDKAKAGLLALFDALIQSPDYAHAIETNVVAPARARLSAQAALVRARTAATRVDFFTVARGED